MKSILKSIASFTIKFIITAIVFLFVLGIKAVYCQDVVKQGNTFVVTKEKANATKEAQKSKYTIKVDGKEYALYVGPKGGVYYIKDGKKCYNVPAEVKKAVKGA